RVYGARVFTADSGQRDCPRFLPDGTEPQPADRTGIGPVDRARPEHSRSHADGAFWPAGGFIGNGSLASVAGVGFCHRCRGAGRWRILRFQRGVDNSLTTKTRRQGFWGVQTVVAQGEASFAKLRLAPCTA